jgi:formamidopyrimidine-DNA glycosylase
MPELPEVETTVRDLAPALLGRRITGAQVFWPRTVAAPHPDEFAARAAGQAFVRFDRRAKFILLYLDGGDCLIVHLRMTGRLHVVPAGEAPGPYTRVACGLDDGSSLHFDDARKFGRIWLVDDPAAVLGRLGPELVGEDFTADLLARTLAGRRAAVKALLLDQRIAAGVGNIYADEALFAAGIDPRRPAGSLGAEEIARLRDALVAVLVDAIAAGGSSLGASSAQNYLRPDGSRGEYREQHQVYQRTGQPCLICGTPIERTVIAQRSAHFCPHCQR